MRVLVSALLLIVFGSTALQAGEVVLLGCRNGEYQQEFWVGSGRQLNGQGLGFEALYCPDDDTMKVYTVVSDSEAFSRLVQLSEANEPDSKRLSASFDAPDSQTAPYCSLFANVGELTFDDIRNTVSHIARPLNGTLDGSVRVSYIHPLCDAPLVPARYYIETKKDFPLCTQGGPLFHIKRATPDPLWD